MTSSLGALAALERAHPLARKLLVAPDLNWGREVLRSLARDTGGWLGWEVTTLRGLAEELALGQLGALGARQATDTQLSILVDRAIATVCRGRTASAAFRDLAEGLGFRRVLKDAVLTLRTAGIGADQVTGQSRRADFLADLAAILLAYQSELDRARLVDPAGLLQLALDQYDAESPYVIAPHMVLAPGLMTSGLAGRLLLRLIDSGARILPAPVPEGPPPARSVMALAAGNPSLLLDAGERGASTPVTMDFFLATSPTEEIREVLRRALSEGRSLDEVEIVATDRDAYGIALDAVATGLGASCTLLDGVPLCRSRVGRALERWMEWLDSGLPADLVREALEAGDLDAPPADASAAARMLRTLHVGWGRARYQQAVGEMAADAFMARLVQRDDESDTAHAERLEHRRSVRDALSALLRDLLTLMPPVPERGLQDEPVATAGELADALASLLARLPERSPADERTLERVRGRLGELSTAGAVPVPFGLAMAEVRDAVADLRAWSDASPAGRPRLSTGGAVHLTDAAHAGTSGRPRTFVVGMDAERTAAGRIQDPVLTDQVRRELADGDLPTLADRREESRWQVASMLARLEGTVTMSCSLASAGNDDVASPAHAMLEAWRRREGDASLGYRELRTRLGEPVSAAPPTPETALDARDAWLAAIAGGTSEYRDGSEVVRQAFPLLDAGLAADAARFGSTLTGWQGLVPRAAGRLDPRRSQDPISPTSLELLASCPLAWFYRYGVRISAPDDPEYDPETWLDPMQRGSLLHALYERVAHAYQGRQSALLDEEAVGRVGALADELLMEWRREVPPPSETVFDAEAAEIRASALAFLEAERAGVESGDARWAAFELGFGGRRAVNYEVAGGTIPVRGRIDRVDRKADGRLVVIDFKTGAPGRYEPDRRTGPFKGGRLLQPAIYADAARTLMEADVARFEYRFPTVRGENRTVAYAAGAFDAARAIIGELLSHVERGEFIPTTDSSDCRFCEYGPICRVGADRFGKVESPRAAWAAEHAESIDAYAAMAARREAP